MALSWHSDCTFKAMAEEEVVTLARSGAPGAAEFLIMRYRSLVESKAKAYFVLGADHDDVVQEGMIGLCKAIRDFRDDRLSNFKAFAELCVTRQIITAVKTATRHKHALLNSSISLHQGLSDESRDGMLIDVIADSHAENPEESAFADRDSRSLYEIAQGSLSKLERQVLIAYLAGKTYREISNELMCETKSIDNALQRVKRKIGELLKQH